MEDGFELQRLKESQNFRDKVLLFLVQIQYMDRKDKQNYHSKYLEWKSGFGDRKSVINRQIDNMFQFEEHVNEQSCIRVIEKNKNRGLVVNSN